MGGIKIKNPFKGNPIKDVSNFVEKATGLDVEEVAAVAAAIYTAGGSAALAGGAGAGGAAAVPGSAAAVAAGNIAPGATSAAGVPLTDETKLVGGAIWGQNTDKFQSEYKKLEDSIKLPNGDEARGIAEESARLGIESLETQNAMLEELYKPYADQAKQTLPELQAMIMGGDIDYKPSKLYEYQKEIGARNIKRTQASRGHYGSTGTESRLAGFYGDLAGEEAQRAYSGAASQIQLGSGASDAIASAGTSTAGNVNSLYSNLQNIQSNISNNVNASRQSLYAGLQNSLQGISQYMTQQGG